MAPILRIPSFSRHATSIRILSPRATTHSTPTPGATVGIVLGSTIGFIICLWILYSCTGFGVASSPAREYDEEIVVKRDSRRKSRGDRPRSHRTTEIREVRVEGRARSPVVVVRDRRSPSPAIVHSRAPSRSPVRYRSRSPIDDIIEVVEEPESDIEIVRPPRSRRSFSREPRPSRIVTEERTIRRERSRPPPPPSEPSSAEIVVIEDHSPSPSPPPRRKKSRRVREVMEEREREIIVEEDRPAESGYRTVDPLAYGGVVGGESRRARRDRERRRE